MKYVLIFALMAVFHNVNAQSSFYDLSATTIDGETFSFAQLKGKKVLIVNTASKCGFTKQYADLEKLYKQYSSKGFVIIGFPANDFLSQEPGTNAEIRQFCTSNYEISFPMMSKITVKGKNMHPVYKWLTDKKLNKKIDSSVKWNFQKYLIDENGNLVEVYYSAVNPLDEKIVNWIDKK